jgi:photosystem II stability/assembly factor-like uncharacterized protein
MPGAIEPPVVEEAGTGWLQPEPEPVRHQDMRSRSARIATLGALVAMAIIGSGCATPATPAHPAVSPPRPFSGTRLAADTLPGQPGSLLSATFVSPSQGWLLVSIRCGPTSCLHLEHTTDAGRRWTAVTSPELGRPALSGRIFAIQFADSRDGWAYGSGPLLATRDGGRTWQAAALPGLGGPGTGVQALGVLDGTVDVLVAEGRNPNDGGPSRLYASDVAHDSWHPVPAVGANGAGGFFASADGVGYAAFPEESATATGTTTTGLALYRSRDGRNWARLPDPPCPGTPAAATSTVLYLVCVDGAAAGSTGKLVYGSADGGRTWRQVTNAPSGGDLDGMAASPDTLLVSWGGGDAGIYVSLNGGEHWATAYAGHIPDAIADMVMITATRGYAIDSGSVLLTTRDAGRRWVAFRAPGGREPSG